MPLFGPPDVATLEAKRDLRGPVKALGHEKDPLVNIRAGGGYVHSDPASEQRRRGTDGASSSPFLVSCSGSCRECLRTVRIENATWSLAQSAG